ncbi:MAG: glycine cleavage system protein H [Thermodesulfobacteriota bacterium]
MSRHSTQYRDWFGFGSVYTSMNRQDAVDEGVDTVLRGQVWRVKPDEKPRVENPCIWMQAGVVKFKTCNNYYDCTTCKYDQAMHKKAQKGEQPTWQQMMRRRPSMHRVCRHTLTNRIGHRICAYDYQCSDCDFDQYFEDILNLKTKSLPYALENVKGFSVPMDYYLHSGHTWVRIESGGYLRVGMDDFALKVLGRMDDLDLPLRGKEVGANRPAWGLARDQHQAHVLSPINGVIMEVNSKIRNKPDLANEDPYGDGWLFMIHSKTIKNQVKSLITDTGGVEWFNQEVGRLESMIEEVAGPMAADGGLLQADVFGNLPQLGWDRLCKTFLKNG